MNLSLNSNLNEIFFYNFALFKNRFPQLCETLFFDYSDYIQKKVIPPVPENYQLHATQIEEAPSLQINDVFYHSKYNPQKEAERIFKSPFFLNDTTQESCIFFGLGLGYLPELYIKKNPQARLLVFEPDFFIFLLFLCARPLDAFFAHPKLSLVIAQNTTGAFDFLRAQNHVAAPIYRLQASVENSRTWFDTLDLALKAEKTKNDINYNTLKKFGNLWRSNLLKNLEQFDSMLFIGALENCFKDCPALILAAGPTLSETLQQILPLKKNFLLIATDTALQACKHASLVPDFVLLFDAQYYNYLHIADIPAPQSVLISELTVYPPVFRHRFKKIMLASSSHPLAKYIEQKLDKKSKYSLATGGSVATAAWDFARFLGCSSVSFAGLDLGFPHLQSHFTGEIFAQNAHQKSTRLQSAESTAFFRIYSPSSSYSENYQNKPLLTDARMLLYRQWFNEKLRTVPQGHTTTFSAKGLRIDAMPVISIADFERINSKSEFSQKKIDALIEKSFAQNKYSRQHIERALHCTVEDLKKMKSRIKNTNLKNPQEYAELEQFLFVEKKELTNALAFIEHEMFEKAGIQNNNFGQAKKIYTTLPFLIETCESLIASLQNTLKIRAAVQALINKGVARADKEMMGM